MYISIKYFKKHIFPIYNGIYQSPLTKLLSTGGRPAVKPLNSKVGLTIKDAIEYPSAVVAVCGGYDGFTFSKTIYRQPC
jgi:hypothetical protein